MNQRDYNRFSTSRKHDIILLTKNQLNSSEYNIQDDDRLNSHFFCLILVKQDQDSYSVIGRVCYSINIRRKQSRLLNLEIFKDSRGRGFGEASLKHIISACANKGIAEISLIVFKHRKAAINLYHKLGFQSVKESNDNIKLVKILNIRN